MRIRKQKASILLHFFGFKVLLISFSFHELEVHAYEPSSPLREDEEHLDEPAIRWASTIEALKRVPGVLLELDVINEFTCDFVG